MQKSSIILVVAISLISSLTLMFWGGGIGILPRSSADQTETKEEPAAAKLPRAVFPQTKYDFDTVAENTEIKHDFIIENHGQAPLVIERVQPD